MLSVWVLICKSPSPKYQMILCTVSQIPNVPGVIRTVTGLVFMIVDLHLKCPCHKMRVYIFEIYDTKYTEIRKQNRNCFFSVKVIAV